MEKARNYDNMNCGELIDRLKKEYHESMEYKNALATRQDIAKALIENDVVKLEYYAREGVIEYDSSKRKANKRTVQSIDWEF